MKLWKTLVRREFWEHRGMWLAPLIAAGFLICVTVVGGVNLHLHGTNFSVGGIERGTRAWVVTTLAIAAIIFLMISMSLFGYLLDCLYGERKDRSILFWRSLPVSDRDTVLTKYAMAMLVMPVYGWVLVVITQTICAGILMAFMPEGVVSIADALSFQGWVHANLHLLYLLVVAVLWYAPLASWLLLASAVAKRTPFAYAFFPIVVAGLVESILFRSNVVRDIVFERLALPFASLRKQGPFVDLDPAPLLQNPQLWYGLVAAAVMVVIAIRLRRYRDDT